MTDILIIGTLAFSFFGALALLAFIGDRLDLTRPEPETERPARSEPCDFSEALRPIGGLPRWAETRER